MVARLMKENGCQGVIRRRTVRTTIADKAAPCPRDLVNRQFRAPAPNRLWVSDFTYVATWTGFVNVAFVIDAFARRIAGWRASRTAHATFVLDAPEQALHARRPGATDGLVHHSDRGGQGGFKRSSQHHGGCCDEKIEAAVRPVGSKALALAGASACVGPR
jgi:putative transposase